MAAESPLGSLRCEEEDCWCARHWPDRAAREYKVVDNDQDGEITWRCDVAIRNNKSIKKNKCDFCERHMIGDCLRVPSKLAGVDDYYCVRCAKKHFKTYLFSLHAEDPCYLLYAISGFTEDGREKGSVCAECGRVHLVGDFETLLTEYKLHGEDQASCLELTAQIRNGLVLGECTDGLRDFMAQCAEDAAVIETLARDASVCAHALLVKHFIPSATDDEAAKLVSKRPRSFSREAVDKAISEQNVAAFVDWLNQLK